MKWISTKQPAHYNTHEVCVKMPDNTLLIASYLNGVYLNKCNGEKIQPAFYLEEGRSSADIRNYERLYELLEQRLSQPGPIRCSNAWELGKRVFSYSYCTKYFKMIMDDMVRMNRAIKASGGVYVINKPDKK